MESISFFLHAVKEYYLLHWIWIGLTLCILSRLITTIYYIEDIDSLRFALATKEFNIVKLQPHFPGYPVFCFMLNAFYWMFGRFSLSFSLIGGIASFLLMWSSREIVSEIYPGFHKWIIDLLIFFNPFYWIMANRYMPDLLGLSITACAFCFFVKYLKYYRLNYLLFFCLLAGLSAGVRLSFLPFLIAPIIFLLFVEKQKKYFQILFLALGVLIWFIPFLIITGWDGMISSAFKHTGGHFYDWGGTIFTEPNYLLRLKGILSGIFAHGLGGFWQGRHWSTMGVTIGVVLGIVQFFRFKKEVFDRIIKFPKIILILFASSFVIYLLWIFFYQNVIFNPRHCMPLVWVVIIITALGYSLFLQKFKIMSILLLIYFMLSYSYITYHVVNQHKKPSAIAQTLNYLKSKNSETLNIISIPMINQYLKNQKLDAQFYNCEDKSNLQNPIAIGSKNKETTIFIGCLPEEVKSNSYKKMIFFHNPFVNTIWPEIELFEMYDRN